MIYISFSNWMSIRIEYNQVFNHFDKIPPPLPLTIQRVQLRVENHFRLIMYTVNIASLLISTLSINIKNLLDK